MADDRRITEVNVGQAFLGFLWSVLFAAISGKVFDAESSLVPIVPIAVVKMAYVFTSITLIIGLVHLFWGWYERVHYLENSQENQPSVTQFVWRFRRVMSGGFKVVGAIMAFTGVTYWIFPDAGINPYEALFVALLWPAWMISVMLAVFDRLKPTQGEGHA